MVVLGSLTHSIWSLVGGGLLSSLTTTVLSHIWLPGQSNRFLFEHRALRELVTFGKWIVFSSGAFVFVSNGDRILLGGFMDAKVLGIYAIASLFITAIETGLSRFFTSVSFPVMSEIARNDPSRLRDVYYKLRLPGDVVLLVLGGALLVGGQSVIEFLYDERYWPAGRMLQTLSISLFAARFIVAQQVYVALGVPRYQAIINLVRFVSLYSLLPALYYLGGIDFAIWAIAIHGLATIPFFYRFNSILGLHDLRREVTILCIIPIGLSLGMCLNLLRT
jgi:O-antigen/teichoic acid export membrane protein